MSCARGCCASQADHYRSVVVRPAASDGTRFESRLGRDRDAYKRMRDEGLQPARVSGAADLERKAQSRFEIESGRILPEKIARRVDDAAKTAAQVQRESA